jgi:hypothetical protein
MITIELKLRWTGLKLAPGVGVSVNYTAFGWTNKVFRVVTWKQGEDDESPVTAVLREDSSGAWDDPAIGAYSTRDDQGVITLGDTVVEPLAVTGFGLDSEPGANKLEWTLPGDQDTVSYYRIYAATSNSFGAANVIWEGHGTSFLHFGVVGTQYWYWIVGVRGVTEGIRAPLAGSPLGSMSTVTGTVLPQATRGAPGQFPYIEDFSDNDYLRFQTEWTGVSATATPEAIVAETGTPAPIGGQYVLEAGNNSGTNDGSFKYLDKGLALPVEDGRLYRMIAVFRKKSGSDNSYFGVVALAADKTTPVGCASNGGNNYYFVRSGYTPSGSAWETHIGYIRTSGGSGDDPALLASTAKFIVPVYAVNNSAGTGSYQIGYLALQEVNSDGEVTTVQLDENAATQTASAFDAGPDTYDNGTLPTPYQTLTFTGGMDDQSVVSVHWNSEVSGALSGGAIADVYLKVDWGGGSSYGAGSALIDATTKVLHLNYTWDTGTIPPDTTFSVEVEVSVGAAGGSTVTLESSTLLVEVIKR